jgi:hypothetical protein
MRMKRTILNKLFTCSLVFCLAGCAENKYAKTIDQLCPQTADKAKAMSACEQVLTGMHFRLEKFDVDAGYIRTAPLSGAQSFEFWRSDNVGSFNQTEAGLQSLRRTVEMNIAEQSGRLCLNCSATTQRLSLPQNQIAADQQSVMVQEQKDAKKLKMNHDKKTAPTWTDLGRDNQLETEILKRIEKQLSVTK